jgi:hypothetical protein
MDESPESYSNWKAQLYGSIYITVLKWQKYINRERVSVWGHGRGGRGQERSTDDNESVKWGSCGGRGDILHPCCTALLSWLWYCVVVFQAVTLWETAWRVPEITLYWFLHWKMNLWLSQNFKTNLKIKATGRHFTF